MDACTQGKRTRSLAFCSMSARVTVYGATPEV
jgi:hypothetical protein